MIQAIRPRWCDCPVIRLAWSRGAAPCQYMEPPLLLLSSITVLRERDMTKKKIGRKKGDNQKRDSADGRSRSKMPNSMACGIDIGDSASLASVFSPSGELVDRFEFEMNSSGYESVSKRVPREARIACEATGMTYPLVRALEGYGYDVTVANPKQLKWIVKSRKKSDKVDSEKLARLLMVGMLPEAHLLSREEQLKRDLLVQRVQLGREIGRMKTRILSYL